MAGAGRSGTLAPSARGGEAMVSGRTHSRSTAMAICVLVIALGIASCAPTPRAPGAVSPNERRTAIGKIADFILSLQGADGAIRDAPDSAIVNEDSNMQYALLGLAAAYRCTGDARYLTGFESGLRWLADREEMTDPRWRGSWYYAYEAERPYAPAPTSPGAGVDDVRGVDTTSAYLAYLLWVDSRLTGSEALARELADNATAGLDFVLAKNGDGRSATYSSWQLRGSRWQLWRYRYTADQADVLLGLRGGAALYPDRASTYASAAARIAASLTSTFFDAANGRYAEGIDERTVDWSEGVDALFPQGYVPWVMDGAGDANASAFHWLLPRSSQTAGSRRVTAPRGTRSAHPCC